MMFVKRVVIPVLSMSLLSACGDMNATSDYEALEKKSGQLHGQRQTVQNAQANENIRISLTKAEFTVGEESKYEISVSAPSGLVYSLEVLNKQPGMNLSRKADGLFELSWKPNENAVALYKGSADLQLKIAMNVNKDASQNRKAIEALSNGQSTEFLVSAKVNRRKGEARIKLVEDSIPATIEEGKSIAFKVEVADPTTESKPDVSYVEVPNAINGALLIAADLKRGLKRNSNGTYTMDAIFNADVKLLPKEVRESLENSNGTVKIQFAFAVTPADGTAKLETPMKTITLQLDKSASAPAIKIDQSGTSRGKKITIAIQAEAKNSRSNTNINLNALKAAIEAEATKLPGKAELVNCKEGNNTRVHSCKIAWTVPCDTADLKSEYSLSVEATSVLFGDAKSATETKTLKLGGACPTKKKPAARSTAKSKTKKTTSKAPTAGGKK